MTRSRRALSALFASLLAGSFGAGCPVCEGEGDEVENAQPRLPPANPGGSPAPAFDASVVSEEECAAVCGAARTGCTAAVESGIPVVVCAQLIDCGGAGRRPRGLRGSSPRATSPAGAWLARAAHLEAASVVAFERLAGALRGLGAPGALVARAERAGRDEARHARIVGRLAASRGGEVPPVRVRPGRLPDVHALALDNAVAGCAQETFAALLAARQARRAVDPGVRRALRSIARDEAAHASLSFRVDAFLATHLDERTRARVRRASRRALLRIAETWSVDPLAAAPLGLPGPAEGRALAAALAEALFP